MPTCRKCNKELTSDNWWPSSKKYGDYICRNCSVKRSIAYAKDRYRKDTGFRTKKLRAQKKERDLRKLEALMHYSEGSLACAGYDSTWEGFGCPFHVNPTHYSKPILLAVLTIDHIDDNGAEERRRLFKHNSQTGGFNFYRWLKKQGWPKGYQVLCFNCQWLKRLMKEDN
jgi:hypothetical protein